MLRSPPSWASSRSRARLSASSCSMRRTIRRASASVASLAGLRSAQLRVARSGPPRRPPRPYYRPPRPSVGPEGEVRKAKGRLGGSWRLGGGITAARAEDVFQGRVPVEHVEIAEQGRVGCDLIEIPANLAIPANIVPNRAKRHEPINRLCALADVSVHRAGNEVVDDIGSAALAGNDVIDGRITVQPIRMARACLAVGAVGVAHWIEGRVDAHRAGEDHALAGVAVDETVANENAEAQFLGERGAETSAV